MYIKESLPLIRRSDLSDMKECLATEINVNNEKWFLTCLYRSPSQGHELESVCSSQLSVCSIVIEYFNAKCSKWCTCDKGNTAGLELPSITTTAGYSQMINKLTHFHCVKSVRIQSYSSPYFPAFGLNTKRYGVSLRI